MIKKCILLLIIIFSPFITRAQADIINNDSTKTSFLSFRCAAGVSDAYMSNYRKAKQDNYRFEFEDNYGVTSELGLRFTSTSKDNTSVTIELNYQFNYYHIDYYEGHFAHMGSFSETAGYQLLLHSVELAFLPKINIGKRKRIYTSFGPFLTVPFYRTIRGTVVNTQSGMYSYYQRIEYKNNEIKKSFHPELGPIIDLGTNIKLKHNTLSIELRLQTNLLNTNYFFRFATSSLAISYTLRSKPIHYTLLTD